MQITWYGLGCFELTAKTATGEATLVVDPYDNATGLRFPRTLAADLVTISHKGEDASNIAAVGGKPFVIDTPGEYEVKGIFVYGTEASRLVSKEEKESNIVYRFEAEGIHVASLGALNRDLTEAELRSLENVDVLLLPVGGGPVLTPKMANELIAQIEPRVVIPCWYSIPNVKEKLGTLEAFLKEVGSSKKEQATKYKFARKDLPEEDMLIMVLERP